MQILEDGDGSFGIARDMRAGGQPEQIVPETAIELRL